MDKILLIGNEKIQWDDLAPFVQAHGYDVAHAEGGRSAGAVPAVIVLASTLTGGHDPAVLRDARQAWPETPVIVVGGDDTAAGGVAAIKGGAFDYLTEPVRSEVLLDVIERAVDESQPRRALRRLRLQAEQGGGLLGMIGKSAPMRHVFEQIQRVAPTRSTDLITGESGTGKELVARAIHELSPWKDGPFVALNCAAIPKDLAESEMFGHAKGAFTGATERRVGKFAAADGGTLLIDEIGDMELPVQAKLVRALETHTISLVGANEEQRVNVRVVAATHRNLRLLVDEGKFREDLYHRLHIIHIALPPLRHRLEDIPVLVAAFLQQFNAEHGRNVRAVTPAAMDCLQRYQWPGNVRELRNVLEGIVVFAQKETIELVDLPLEIRANQGRDMVPADGPGTTLADLERRTIQECLLQTGGSRQRTAATLGISTRTLLRKIRHFRLADPLHAESAGAPPSVLAQPPA